jgi:hypothetical protein
MSSQPSHVDQAEASGSLVVRPVDEEHELQEVQSSSAAISPTQAPPGT